MALSLQEAFDQCNGTGCRLSAGDPPGVVGIAEHLRVLRPARLGGDWVLWRDVYWLGAQQGSHVVRVVRWVMGLEDLYLWTADEAAPMQLEPALVEDSVTIAAFRAFAAEPGSGYEGAEERQQASLAAFVDELDAAG